jgi:hypothetical protein
MSNYWDIRCMTCSGPGGRVEAQLNLNHGADRLVPLLKCQAEAAALVRKLDAATSSSGSWLDVACELPPWVNFMASHEGHELKVFSEYGYAHDQCDRDVDCGECGHTHHCALPSGHEGAHSRKKTEAAP